jgi:TM2 domain-containing membrane protein YozV
MAEQAGQGSTGNVIAAVCSFFMPGLGQLVQGRVLTALIHVLLGVVVWVVSFGMLGWIVHILSAIEAARWKPKEARD